MLRGWGEYYKRAHVRGLFHQLDRLDRAAPVVASVPALALCGVAYATLQPSSTANCDL